MKAKTSTKDSSAHIRHLKNILLLIDILTIAALAIVIPLFTINKTDETLKSQVSSMATSLNVQMKMNLNSYLYRVETISSLIFSSDEVYKYDATDTSNDEYEMIKTESRIADTLYGICLMENFVDFAIVYRNNHYVGKMSNATPKLFGEDIYNDLSGIINRKVTSDGWSAGYENNYKRIYYVKTVNENAVLLVSFYANELDSVFEHPGGLADMTVRLIEQDNMIIYSSNKLEKGTPLPENISKKIKNHSSAVLINDDYLITINSCCDNWRVICSIPTQIILKEKNDYIYFVFIISIATAVIVAVVSIFLINKIIQPVKTIVERLDDEAHIDLLTGVFNKRSFEKAVENTLENIPEGRKSALILLDIDNFKGVNDTLGHAYGDKVLVGVGDIIKKVFYPEDFLGRLGGDEFCVYLNISDIQQENYMAHIKEKCNELCQEFRKNYTGDDNSYKISASIGAAIVPEHGKKFHELYKCADDALYISKHKGKDTFTIYEAKKATEVSE